MLVSINEARSFKVKDKGLYKKQLYLREKEGRLGEKREIERRKKKEKKNRLRLMLRAKIREK